MPDPTVRAFILRITEPLEHRILEPLPVRFALLPTIFRAFTAFRILKRQVEQAPLLPVKCMKFGFIRKLAGEAVNRFAGAAHVQAPARRRAGAGCGLFAGLVFTVITAMPLFARCCPVRPRMRLLICREFGGRG
ncbi:MAG TPA: hypothetical protein DCO73_01525 [Alphaproteobacteria bacterium]|nr:hypothetical protein [Alphaproteobacteria bacterium]